MKTNTQPPISDYITKQNFQQALDQQTIQLSKILSNYVTKKDFEETIEKQTIQLSKILSNYVTKRDLEKTIHKQTKWVQKKFDQHTKSFSDLVNNLTIDLGHKFDEQDKKFIQIDKRFEQIDKRFEQVDEKFDQIDQQFKQIRIDIAESSSMIIDELKSSREEQTILGYCQRQHTDQIKDHDSRISTLEENYQITN